MSHEVRLYPYETGKKRKVEVDGVLYSSMNEMRDRFHLSESSIRRYEIENNCSKEKAIEELLDIKEETAKKKCEKQKKERKEKLLKQEKRKFMFRGMEFVSYKDCIGYYNEKCHDKYLLNAESIEACAKRRDCSRQEIIQEQLERKTRKKIRRNFASNQKYQWAMFNTKEKMLACKNALGERCIETFKDTYFSKWHIKYKTKKR